MKRFALAVSLAVLLLSSAAHAQITNVSAEQAPPIPQAGHDYIQLLSEIVSPGIGSVSIRVQGPVPKGRELTIPFAIDYDSNSSMHTFVSTNPGWTDNSGYLAQGGWSYIVPFLSITAGTRFVGQQGPTPCHSYKNYIFGDLSGGVHGFMGVATAIDVEDPQVVCQAGGGFQSYLTGADSEVVGVSNPMGSDTSIPPAFTVSDSQGNVYYFSGTGLRLHSTPGDSTTYSPHDNNSILTSIPDWVESRNGNKMAITDARHGSFTIADTLGRNAVATSGFGTSGSTISFSGLAPYTVTWQTQNNSWTYNPVVIPTSDNGCHQPSVVTTSSSQPEVSQITLSNGKAYTFLYEPTYGLLSKVIYPDGGYVRYVWGNNTLSGYALFPNVIFPNNDQCEMRYDTPALQHRFVSFDGVTEAQEQDFSYATTWTNYGSSTYYLTWSSKTTTVVTKDLVTGTQSKTIYTYGPADIPGPPVNPPQPPPTSPAEILIQTYNTSGTLIRTVSKKYFDPQLPPVDEKMTLENGRTSEIVTCFLGSTCPTTTSQSHSQISDRYFYDYGATTGSPSTIGTPGALLKHVHADFVSTALPLFSSGPLVSQSDTITYNGSATRVAETDYAYDQTPLQSVAATGHDETIFPPSRVSGRGNVTTTTIQCFSNCANAVTTYTYDETGQLVSMIDACGNGTCNDLAPGNTNHTTSYSYADSYTIGTPPGNTNAYLTKITHPPTNGTAHVENLAYSYADGQLTQSSDQNQQVTHYLYNDPLGRLTETDYPDGGQTLISYNDSVPSVTTQRLQVAGSNLSTVAVRDKMGHVIDNQQTSAPVCSIVHTTASYDGLGRPYQVSNPYCTTSDATYGLTTYSYDALGRATLLTHPDSSTVQTTYTGEATEVTDEGTQEPGGAKRLQRISQSDALGRLKSACEVSSAPLTVGSSPTPASCNLDIAGTGFLTTYGYDALGNLTSVSQGGLNPRTFTYNSVSRLVCSASPEIQNATCPASDGGTYVSGTVRYVYDTEGNLSQKISPKPNQTSPSVTVTAGYVYDALYRLTGKNYNDGTPSIVLSYDQSGYGYSIGRMTSGSALQGSTTVAESFFTYDQMGRVTGQEQCGSLNCPSAANHWKTLYGYDDLGNILYATNGMGVTVHYVRNAIGQINHMTSSLVDFTNHPSTLISSLAYNAPGNLVSGIFGGFGHSVTESLSYTNRLQAQSLQVIFGSTTRYSFSLSYAPNGDVLSSSENLNGGFLGWSYLYDDFNRLASATQSGQPSYTDVYDRYGNRWKQLFSGACTSGPTFCLTFDNNNHVSNGLLTYDAAGNVTADNMHHYTYDAENHLISVDNGATASYAYDYAGNRVRKTANGLSLDYIYDLDGRAVTEVSVPQSGFGTWTRTEVYADGRHLATYAGGASGTTYFNHSNWLGTERVRTGVSSGVTVETCTSLAFGDNLFCTGTDTSPLHFTGKQHDSESGLDDFEARYLGSNLGRFVSSDPSNLSVDFFLPQTWNRYVHALNNPLTIVDRNGLWPTSIHEEIINTAFAGLTSGERQILRQASYDTDYNNRINGHDPQDPAVSFVHGMSDGLTNQDPMQAQQQGDAFIAQNEHDAQQIQADWIAAGNTGISPAALTAFGNALHTITDRLSPAHAGNQPWYGTAGAKNKLRAARHFARESHINTQQWNAAIAAARQAFIRTFGEQFDLVTLHQIGCVTVQSEIGPRTTCD